MRFTTLRERLTALANSPISASAALIALCLAVYLPGVIRLPAVDRTEVVYAETTRDMVQRGDWTDPRFGGVVHQYRPIGTFWAQGAALTAAGPSHERDIIVYRLPGLMSVVLSVLALFLMGRALVGNEAAMIAAGLFAVAPLTVLLATLSIAESISLLPATVAMLALLRVYADPEPKPKPKIVMPILFWTALGLGIAVNALLVPIIVAATLIALFLMDRNLRWLTRLRPVFGLPVALALASPWLIIRAHQDGSMFAGMGWREFLGALGGAQDMKLRAYPGTFILAALLGFLPGTALLGASARRLWVGRNEKLARFLLAWVIGYIVYLEAISSKPGTYMVQTLFPALALGVASLVVSEDEGGTSPKGHWFPWPTSAAILPVAVFAGVYWFADQLPTAGVAALIAIVMSLFVLSVRQGHEGQLRMWALSGIGALGLFAVTLLGLVLPPLDRIWPSRQLAGVMASCRDDEISILGFREPTSRFLLKSDPRLANPETIAARMMEPRPHMTFIEDRWQGRASAALGAQGGAFPAPLGCVTGYNTMRGCALRFRIYETGADRRCALPPQYACDAQPFEISDKKADCD